MLFNAIECKRIEQPGYKCTVIEKVEKVEKAECVKGVGFIGNMKRDVTIVYALLHFRWISLKCSAKKP